MPIVNSKNSSILKSMNSTLKRIDFFGLPVALTFEKQKKFKTYIGGLTSLIIYSLLSVFAIKEGLNLLERKNPIVNQIEKHYEEPQFIDIRENNFFAAFFMDKNDKIINDPSYFYFEIYQYYRITEKRIQKSLKKIKTLIILKLKQQRKKKNSVTKY